LTTQVDAPRPGRRRLLTWGLPALAIAVAALVAGLHSESDHEEANRAVAAADASRSSTIARSVDGRSLWVTSPDDDRLLEVDPSSLEVVQAIDVPGQPRELTVIGERVLVTGAQSTALAVVDPEGPGGDAQQPGEPDVGSIPLPCGGSRGVVTVPASAAGPERDLAVVTCPTDDRVVVVDLEAGRMVGTIAMPGRPTGIVRDGSTVTVSTAGDGHLHAIPTAGLEELADGKVSVADSKVTRTDRTVWVDGKRTAASLAALDHGPHGPLGTYQVVDNQRKLTRAEIEAGSTYGSPKDGRARLEPAIAGSCGARFSSLTDEPRRLSGPVALAASPTSDLVWVVGEFSHSVSVVRCDGTEPRRRSVTVAAFDVGEGARGIVLDPSGRRAFVDVGFDHQIAELRLPRGAEEVAADDGIERTAPTKVGRRVVEDRYLSPLAQQGRRMFNDATDTHLTPFGVVTCGSCHPSAGEDGLNWRIETVDETTKRVERKVRRTPPAWQVDPEVKPLHWDGEFTSSDDLTLTTIQRLLGGDGLLVDSAAISAYLAEVQAPPERPVITGDRLTRAVRHGKELVTRLGCTSCHAGEAGTDGKPHDVLDPSEVPDGELAAVITPPLRSVRGRAPYGHDGRAPDLAALLLAHGDGKGGTIDLTPEELVAVVAYLDTR
jgi:DNA-binding beta-propeller fold protein YncE